MVTGIQKLGVWTRKLMLCHTTNADLDKHINMGNHIEKKAKCLNYIHELRKWQITNCMFQKAGIR